MKKTILLILIASTFYKHANCQITEGNWMVRGNASFVFSKASGDNNTKTANLSLAPNIGYFFMDKFAGGVRLTYNRDHIKYWQINTNFSTFENYSIGPFVRYYFLDVDKQYNILMEGSYQFGNDKVETTNYTSNNSTTIISFSAGPVIYFNSSVGIEFLLNYSSTGTIGYKGRGNSFGAGIGLQIHLEKDKN